MPATSGRVKMPSDNRMNVQVRGSNDETIRKGNTSERENTSKQSLNLTRIFGSSGAQTPGSCKRCGEVGHLTFQCRNPIKSIGLVAIDAEAVAAKTIQQSSADWKLVAQLREQAAQNALRSSKSHRYQEHPSSNFERGVHRRSRSPKIVDFDSSHNRYEHRQTVDQDLSQYHRRSRSLDKSRYKHRRRERSNSLTSSSSIEEKPHYITNENLYEHTIRRRRERSRSRSVSEERRMDRMRKEGSSRRLLGRNGMYEDDNRT